MPLRSLVSSLIFAGLVAVPFLTAPTPTKAESLIDFLWGGSSEWGGKRQTVSFNPKYTPDQIIVSFGDRRLYLITKKGQAISYPIAVPRDKSRWQGTTKISAKKINPSWRPTPEMLQENPKLPHWVPGGHPMNPLGVRAMYLGASAYRIHGTDAPWTIGKAVSQGCIRMTNEDVLDLYPRVPVGMRVTVTWERFSDQSVASYEDASTHDVPTTTYNDVPQPLQPTAYQESSSRHVIRNLPPLPQSVRDAQLAAVRMEPAKPASDEKAEKKAEKPATEKKAVKVEKPAVEKKAEKAEKPAVEKKVEKVEKPAPTIRTASRTPDIKPGAKADTDKSPSAAATRGAESAVEAARRAAAAAAKAAEAARKAAEAAKRAAEDARRATSSDTAKEPDKTAPKSAAL
jgi:L,D-transpeptidase catalytic domain